MLKRINRLTKQKDFDSVYKKGRSVYDQYLGIKTINNGQDENRYGIVISSKVSKKATTRNRYKRYLREAIKQSAVKISGGNDIVIIVFPAVTTTDQAGLLKSFNSALARLKLLSS